MVFPTENPLVPLRKTRRIKFGTKAHLRQTYTLLYFFSLPSPSQIAIRKTKFPTLLNNPIIHWLT
jgi:hypothetical protein